MWFQNIWYSSCLSVSEWKKRKDGKGRGIAGRNGRKERCCQSRFVEFTSHLLFSYSLYVAEQESVITSLHEKSARQNAIYIPILTLIPILFTLPLFYTLSTNPLQSLLGITSLVMSSTRVGMHFTRSFGAYQGERRRKRGRGSEPLFSSATINQGPMLSRLLAYIAKFHHLIHKLISSILSANGEDGPLFNALPWLNVFASLLCASMGLLIWRRAGRSDANLGQTSSINVSDITGFVYFLPAIALIVVEVALKDARTVDRGIRELEGLKYRYKGA